MKTGTFSHFFSVSLNSHSCLSGVVTSDSGMTESMGGKGATCGMFTGKLGRAMYYKPKLFPDLLLDPRFQTQNRIAKHFILNFCSYKSTQHESVCHKTT